MSTETKEMEGVREYGDGLPVELLWDRHHQRWVIEAMNEGGQARTSVDLIDLVEWLKEHRPELFGVKGGEDV